MHLSSRSHYFASLFSSLHGRILILSPGVDLVGLFPDLSNEIFTLFIFAYRYNMTTNVSNGSKGPTESYLCTCTSRRYRLPYY